MPAIPNSMLQSVVYLYRDSDDALEGKNAGGSGFLVSLPSKTHAGKEHVYVISNWHVAIKGGFSAVRVNTDDGSTRLIESDPSEWEFVVKGGDLAVLPTSLNTRIDRCSAIEARQIAAASMQDFYRTGEDVFMLGRFIDEDGGQRNQPAARFGNISVLPIALNNPPSNSDADTKYYLLDMHSKSGFSGSPVFAYRTMGSVIGQKMEALRDVWGNVTLPLHAPMVGLIGIHCGHYNDSIHVQGPFGDAVATGPSGMTYALPATSIVALLDCPKLTQRRQELDEQWRPRR